MKQSGTSKSGKQPKKPENSSPDSLPDASVSDSTDISVAILTTVHRTDLLHQCLSGILRGDLLPNQIVIGNNSDENADDDEINSIVGSFSKKLNLTIERFHSLAFAEARNAVLEKTHHRLIAILDDDCVPDRKWLAKLKRGLENFDAVGGFVKPPNHIKLPRDWDPELNWVAGISPPSQAMDKHGVRSCPSTSNMAFRREVWEEIKFQEVGGFLNLPEEEANYLIGREDAQFWRSVRDAGFRTANIPEAIVTHYIPEERFRVGHSISRARADGVSDWHRNRDNGSLPMAASDILRTPVKIAEDLITKERSFRHSRRLHETWAARQWSHLQAAVNDQNHGIDPVQRNMILIREATKITGGLVQRGLRKIVAGTYRTLRDRFMEHDPTEVLDETLRHHVMIACYPFLGDALLWLPYVRELARKRPMWKITLVLSPATASIYRYYLGSKISILELPAGLSIRDVRQQLDLISEMRDNPPSAVLMAYFHRASPWFLYFSHFAPVYTWEHNEGLPRQLWRDCAFALPKGDGVHETENIQRLLSVTGLKTDSVPELILKPEPDAKKRVGRVLEKFGLSRKEFVVFLLDDRKNEYKYWPLDKTLGFLKQWVQKSRIPVVVSGTKSGRPLFEQILLQEPDPRFHDAVHSTHGFFSPLELFALYEASLFVTGIDSGPIHLARLAGVPTLTMVGATDDKRWGATMEQLDSGLHKIVRADRAPYEWTLDEARSVAENEHMRRLEPEAVVQEALDLLEKVNSKSST